MVLVGTSRGYQSPSPLLTSFNVGPSDGFQVRVGEPQKEREFWCRRRRVVVKNFNDFVKPNREFKRLSS
ncbi:hypothetical protein JCM12825_21400 [Desulfurobacterium crinifex]